MRCQCGARRRSSALENAPRLRWTEAVTEIGRNRVSDALYDDARTQFSDKELVDLTFR
jgi:alkylhydroperoxidase family enzyme